MIKTVQEAWCRETSSDPEKWTPENPAWGQCAVTALIVQDFLGGDLIRLTHEGVSHYGNFAAGNLIDLTASQFSTPVNWNEHVIRTREYVLSFLATKARYELLKQRMGL